MWKVKSCEPLKPECPELYSFLKEHGLEAYLAGLHERGVKHPDASEYVGTMADLCHLCPKMEDNALHSLKMLKAIAAHNNQSSTGANGRMQNKSAQGGNGRAGEGEKPWSKLPEWYTTLGACEDYEFPIWPILKGISAQGTIQLKTLEWCKFKNCMALQIIKASGVVYKGINDDDDFVPILNIIAPQFSLKWGEVMTRYMQQIRSGVAKPYVPIQEDVQGFAEILQFRPVDTARQVDYIADFDNHDKALEQQIVGVLAGPCGIAQKKIKAMLLQLENLRGTAHQYCLGDRVSQLVDRLKDVCNQPVIGRKVPEEDEDSDSDSDSEEEEEAEGKKRRKKQKKHTAKKLTATPKQPTKQPTKPPSVTAHKQPKIDDFIDGLARPRPAAVDLSGSGEEGGL
jgi:hypothetical protein